MSNELCNDCMASRCPCCGEPLDTGEFEIVGTLRLISGRLFAGDKVHFGSERCPIIELPRGDYVVAVAEFDGTPARLRLTSRADAVIGDRLGKACIDTGELSLADAYYESVFSASVPSGFGDGSYDIFEVVSDGLRVGIEVVFLDLDDDDYGREEEGID